MFAARQAPSMTPSASIDAEKPDVVLLDVHMPGGGGVEVIRQVARTRPAQRFLALSVSDAPEDVIAVVRAGARGYVTKAISGADLADAVRRVREGDAVFSPRLAGFVLDAFAGEIDAADIDPELDQLTMREREVLRHIARGYLYKEIALELGISVKTVEAHVSRSAAQAPALEPPRARPLGGRAAAGRLTYWPMCSSGGRARAPRTASARSPGRLRARSGRRARRSAPSSNPGSAMSFANSSK